MKRCWIDGRKCYYEGKTRLTLDHCQLCSDTRYAHAYLKVERMKIGKA